MIGASRGRTRSLALLAALVAGLLTGAAGCGYSVAGRATASSFLPEDVQTIGIPTLVNETDQADIDQRITEALIDEFVQRGRVEAVPRMGDVDVLLEGTISAFREEPVTFTAGGRFERVEVMITAQMRLVRSSPEAVLWSQSNYVFRQQYDVPETPTAEFDRQIVAIDQIAEDFARSVVTSILEGF